MMPVPPCEVIATRSPSCVASEQKQLAEKATKLQQTSNLSYNFPCIGDSCQSTWQADQKRFNSNAWRFSCCGVLLTTQPSSLSVLDWREQISVPSDGLGFGCFPSSLMVFSKALRIESLLLSQSAKVQPHSSEATTRTLNH